MTCKEKLIDDYPGYSDDEIDYVLDMDCPTDRYGVKPPMDNYGYIMCGGQHCVDCWNQEVPNTFIDSSNIQNEKEKTMTTKKTKAQLMEELETSENTVKNLKQQLKDLEKYKVYEDAGAEMKAIHTAFMNAGFTDDQAFELIRLSMMSQISNTTNANIRCDFNYDALRKAAKR